MSVYYININFSIFTNSKENKCGFQIPILNFLKFECLKVIDRDDLKKNLISLWKLSNRKEPSMEN